jgi:hypothetical protein
MCQGIVEHVGENLLFARGNVVLIHVGNYVENEALNILEVDAFPLYCCDRSWIPQVGATFHPQFFEIAFASVWRH